MGGIEEYGGRGEVSVGRWRCVGRSQVCGREWRCVGEVKECGGRGR